MCSSECSTNLIATALSTVFDKNVKFEIGRNEFISSGSRFVFFNLHINDYGGIDTKIEFVSFVLDEIHLVTFERLQLVDIPFRIVDYILTHM